MTIRATSFAVAAIATTVALGCVSSVAQAGYYDGKTVEVIVGLRAGGTADRLARAFAEVWQKHIPGNPTFVVKNMPGAGSLKATNFVYEKAKPNGETVLFGPWAPVSQALKDPAMRAQYDDFPFLGGLTDLRVNYVRTDIVPGGMKTQADIIKATPESLKLGGNNATGISDLLGRMMFDVLGVKYGYVTGFRGGSGIFAAMKRNEVQAHNTSISSFRSRSAEPVEKGEMMGVAYSVPVRDDGSFDRNPNVKDMPAFPDLYKEIHGKMPSGPQWEAYNWFVGLVGEMAYGAFVPPGTPKEATEELSAAFAKGCSDKEFVGPLMKTFGIAHDCVSVARGKEIIASIDGVDPKILATFKKTIEEGMKN